MIPETGNPLDHLLSVLMTGEYWRYLIDARHQARGRMGYAEGSYIQSLLGVVQHIPHFLGRKISVEDIKKLHELAMHNVTATRYDHNESLDPSQCRTDEDASFALTKHIASTEGLLELIQRLKRERCCFMLRVVDPVSGVTECLSDENIKEKLESTTQELLVERLQRYNLYLDTMHFKQEPHSVVENILKDLLDSYYAEIVACRKPIKKLYAIAKLCHLAIQVHPFHDGNGRLFCILMPQILCLQNNFFLPLIEFFPNLIYLTRNYKCRQLN